MMEFSIDQLMLFVGGCASSLVLIVLAFQKSKCTEIGFCGCKIKRDVNAVVKSEKLGLTGHSGDTPKPDIPVDKLNLILEEKKTNK